MALRLFNGIKNRGAKRRALHCHTVNSCFPSKHFARLVGALLGVPLGRASPARTRRVWLRLRRAALPTCRLPWPLPREKCTNSRPTAPAVGYRWRRVPLSPVRGHITSPQYQCPRLLAARMPPLAGLLWQILLCCLSPTAGSRGPNDRARYAGFQRGTGFQRVECRRDAGVTMRHTPECGRIDEIAKERCLWRRTGFAWLNSY